MKVWDRAGIELATPGSAVSLASVARHDTNCARRLEFIAVKNEIFAVVLDFFYIMHTMFVCVDALHPSQQFFSHVGMIPCLPGFNKY